MGPFSKSGRPKISTRLPSNFHVSDAVGSLVQQCPPLISEPSDACPHDQLPLLSHPGELYPAKVPSWSCMGGPFCTTKLYTPLVVRNTICALRDLELQDVRSIWETANINNTARARVTVAAGTNEISLATVERPSGDAEGWSRSAVQLDAGSPKINCHSAAVHLCPRTGEITERKYIACGISP